MELFFQWHVFEHAIYFFADDNQIGLGVGTGEGFWLKVVERSIVQEESSVAVKAFAGLEEVDAVEGVFGHFMIC